MAGLRPCLLLGEVKMYKKIESAEYLMSKSIIQGLLNSGLISNEEFKEIDKENMESFSGKRVRNVA